MAGFGDIKGFSGFKQKLAKLGDLGLKYEDLLIKNSETIGFIEGEMRQQTGAAMNVQDDLMQYSLALSDTTSKMKNKALAFFQQDYQERRTKLRDVASQGEIEFILEIIADTAIVFDDNHKFCHPIDINGKTKLKGKNKEEKIKYEESVVDSYYKAFEKVYDAWGFGSGIAAWQYMYRFLVEGHLAFEIIYDDITNPKNIIGFKELDPATLYPHVTKTSTGEVRMEWVQYSDIEGQRTLQDSQIIYLSYSNHFETQRVSFTERLIRPFNLLRLIEQSKIIWHTMNAPLRLQTKVPIGTKPINKAREDLREFSNTYKEEVQFDDESGSLSINGSSNINFYKNYILPKNKEGESIDIEPIEYPGPNLSDSELLNYFMNKLKLVSKIPNSRWDFQNGMGQFTLNVEGINQEEIKFSKFIERLRSVYSEIITKPMFLQMCLEHNGIKEDPHIKNAMGLRYNNENIYEELKDAELVDKRVNTLETLQKIKDDNGQPYFSTEFLVRSKLKLTPEEIKSNEYYAAKFGRGGGGEEGEGAGASMAASGGAGSSTSTGGAGAPGGTGGEAGGGAGSETNAGGETGGSETASGGETGGSESAEGGETGT